ncbi:hypothetical protein NQ317_019249 [Molorchus minor]|uniref:Transposase n=1 Tax=Molorchus minor TaxID=1323400 RepID=A0ABQ9JSL1_9CUCU|nr:hypothetical protein NQ317_019249 [Molorchus minor]
MSRLSKKKRLQNNRKISNTKYVIYNITKNKQYITRNGSREELKNRQILEVSNTMLSNILKNIGYHYRKVNGKKALIERPEISLKRIQLFLKEFIKNATSENPLDVVFLDETWIFQLTI